MKQEYRFVHASTSGHTVDYIVRAREAFFENDALVVEAESRAGEGSRTATYLRRDDAIDLAWSILEHYGVTERPPAPLAVGDLVEITSDFIHGKQNRLGKIEKDDLFEGDYLIRGANGSLIGWKNSSHLARLTKEEFLAKVSARTAKFVGEG